MFCSCLFRKETGNKQILIAVKAGRCVQDVLKTVQSFDAVPLAQIAISYGRTTDALTLLGTINTNSVSKLTTVVDEASVPVDQICIRTERSRLILVICFI